MENSKRTIENLNMETREVKPTRMASELPEMAMSELLQYASDHGITILRDGEDLRIVFREGVKPAPEFLQVLKERKPALMEYLATTTQANEVSEKEMNNEPGGLDHDGERYYPVSPVQSYWLDDNEDTEYKQIDKHHGIVKLQYRLTGDLDIPSFRDALGMLIRKHESLRATFHKLDGLFMMRVEPQSPDHTILKSEADDDQEDFSFAKGPLIKTWLINKGNNDYLLVIKLRHVITDTWSNEVLFRDLWIAYRSLVNPGSVLWQSPKYQFSDLLIKEHQYREKNYTAHRSYWTNRFPRPPARLSIPGARGGDRMPLKDRVRKTFCMDFSHALKERLQSLSKVHKASLFVVLQASFKAFLWLKTGIADIVVGTAVSGRDLPETYDQIGSYARTLLIRTQFADGDSFAGAIEKVRFANEEMRSYRAFTLLDNISAQMPPGAAFDQFLTCNLFYLDRSLFHAYEMKEQLFNGLPIGIEPVWEPHNPVMPIDMMVEFVNAGDTLEMKVQYDSTAYDHTFMVAFFEQYLHYTSAIAADPGSRMIS